jgi:hypothetical protein
MGPDNLILWVGYQHDVDFDYGEVDLSKIIITNSKEYQYIDSDITYSYGKSNKIRGKCPNLIDKESLCYCLGLCMSDAPFELQVDERYIAQTSGN